MASSSAEVAQVIDLELTVGVLVDGQRIDHPNRVAVPQPLQFGDDLAVEVRVAEPQHDELHGSNGHVVPPVYLIRDVYVDDAGLPPLLIGHRDEA